MLNSGLVSVTFRNLKPSEIVKLVLRADLNSIEWGGDIHVPHGDINTAKATAAMTIESGLAISSYGSYYEVGTDDEGFNIFKKVLETAVALKAPVIRVWAGQKGSNEADENYISKVVEVSLTIAELAMQAGIVISFEFHGGTLTDTNESALSLLDKIGHVNIKSFWQPAISMNTAQRLDGIKKLGSRISNIHVFHWEKDDKGCIVRKSLEEGQVVWKEYFKYLKALSGNRYALLEFVKDDDSEQFIRDARTLKYLLSE